jgi:hypothetical protein
MQAMGLFKDTHLVKLDLLSNATTIDNALSDIRNKQQGQQNKRMLPHSTITDNEDKNDYEHRMSTSIQTIFRLNFVP